MSVYTLQINAKETTINPTLRQQNPIFKQHVLTTRIAKWSGCLILAPYVHDMGDP